MFSWHSLNVDLHAKVNKHGGEEGVICLHCCESRPCCRRCL